jgi:hypothetical protein
MDCLARCRHRPRQHRRRAGALLSSAPGAGAVGHRLIAARTPGLPSSGLQGSARQAAELLIRDTGRVFGPEPDGSPARPE